MKITEAEGLAELGLWEEAWEAIEDLSTDERIMAPAMRLRMRCAAHFGKWEMVEVLAQVLRHGDEEYREEAACAFQSIAAEHLHLGDREKAKAMIKEAIDTWPEQRAKIIEDERLADLF